MTARQRHVQPEGPRQDTVRRSGAAKPAFNIGPDS